MSHGPHSTCIQLIPVTCGHGITGASTVQTFLLEQDANSAQMVLLLRSVHVDNGQRVSYICIYWLVYTGNYMFMYM